MRPGISSRISALAPPVSLPRIPPDIQIVFLGFLQEIPFEIPPKISARNDPRFILALLLEILAGIRLALPAVFYSLIFTEM